MFATRGTPKIVAAVDDLDDGPPFPVLFHQPAHKEIGQSIDDQDASDGIGNHSGIQDAFDIRKINGRKHIGRQEDLEDQFVEIGNGHAVEMGSLVQQEPQQHKEHQGRNGTGCYTETAAHISWPPFDSWLLHRVLPSAAVSG